MPSSAVGFDRLEGLVRDVIENHYKEVVRCDTDIYEGILPLLQKTETSLVDLEAKNARISGLLQLQERYRQDCGNIKKRVMDLYAKASAEDINQTDNMRQEMHDRAKAASEKIKTLKDQVKAVQETYHSVAGMQPEGQERLNELRVQIRRLGERLRRFHDTIEGRRREDKDGETAPPISS